MAKLNLELTRPGSVWIAAALAAGLVWLAFTPFLKGLQGDVRRTGGDLEEARALLALKPALQSEWDAKKAFFNPGLDPDAALNAWIKDLLTLAQSQGLVLEKLEPAGIKKDTEGKSLTVFVAFQGDIRQFLRFMYQLMEKDPLSRIESFGARQEEASKPLAFELLLGKAVK